MRKHKEYWVPYPCRICEEPACYVNVMSNVLCQIVSAICCSCFAELIDKDVYKGEG